MVEYISRITPKVGDIYDLTEAEARQLVRACCINSGKYKLYDGEIVTGIQLDGMSAQCIKDDYDDPVEWSHVEISCRFCGRWHRVYVDITNDTAGDYTLCCCWRLDDDYIPARDEWTTDTREVRA